MSQSGIEEEDPSKAAAVEEEEPGCSSSLNDTEEKTNAPAVVENSDQVYEKIRSKQEILDIKFHPSESKLISLGLINGKLKIYDLSRKEKRLVSVHKLHKKSIRRIAYPLNNTDLIFTASKDKSIKLTDLKHEANVLTLEAAHDAPLNCMITIDNWLIASADDNGAVKIWDYRRKSACMECNTDCSDYISDLAVSKDKKILLATCGEGTLSAFHTRKKKLVMQSELMESELLSVAFMKNDKKTICGDGDGVLSIFNRDEWGNISDRFPGHPSSIDCLLPLSDNVVLTGCFDGNIRACHIMPNRFLGIVGNHDDFPVQAMCLSSDGTCCASISHDEHVKFWSVEKIRNVEVDAQSKSKNKTLKNKALNKSGKSDNFFGDLAEDKDDNDDDDDDDDDDEDSDDTDSDDSDDDDDSDD